MCGISGSGPSSSGEFLGKLHHRGPDQSCEVSSPEFRVNFYRLAVTGGPAGEAPIASQNGNWLVFLNGEIYNFRSLQSSSGLRFHESDTQTIADGLEKFGLRFLHDLRGMYALVIWNRSLNRVYFVRDPLGEKPLYYARVSGGFVFASEFRSVLRALDGTVETSRRAVLDYLRFGYIEEPITLDRRIMSFPRGHVIELSLDDFTANSLFSIKGYSADETALPLADLLHVVAREIGKCDVPATIAVSGGIDSVGLAKLLSDSPTRRDLLAFTVEAGIGDRDSETERARNAAENLGMEHEVLEEHSASFPERILDLCERYDQPHSDLAGLHYSNLFRATAGAGRKVMFMGHGPDELFFGYSSEIKILKDRGFLNSLGKPRKFEYWDTESKLKDVAGFIHDAGWSKRDFGSKDRYLRARDAYRRLRAHLVHSYLSHNALAQSDRLSMSFGVEARTPFADSRLYGWSQANNVANTELAMGKEIFMKSLKLGGLEYIKAQPKQGFRSKVAHMIRDHDLLEFAGSGVEFVNDALGKEALPEAPELRLEALYRMTIMGGTLASYKR